MIQIYNRCKKQLALGAGVIFTDNLNSLHRRFAFLSVSFGLIHTRYPNTANTDKCYPTDKNKQHAGRLLALGKSNFEASVKNIENTPPK